MNNSSLRRNVVISVSAQLISILVSFILNLVVPKFISEIQYSYWQTYILYVGYVGILHFGLLDGIVLRYSQYDYEDLDKLVFRSQFKLLLLFNSIMSIIVICIGFLISNINYKYIFIFVALGIISKNCFTYTSYTFQITNRISLYAILVIAQKLFCGAITIALLILKVKSFYLFCLADLCGDVFGIVVGYINNKELYFGKSISFKKALLEFKINTTSGIMLLIANWSSMLLIGSAKMIVQWHWNDLTFGKVSFSFSVSSLFLTFVTAISVVLFPSLKRMDKDNLPNMYLSIRNAISPLLFIALLLYFPGCIILDKWLPKYHSSLFYLGILLPIIIFSSKVSLLTNNYLKAYRKEKTMLTINVVFVLIAFFVFFISAFLIDNLTVLLVSIVIIIMFRSIISEVIVMRIINITIFKDFIIESFMTIAFIICSMSFSLLYGFIIYAVLLLIYLSNNRTIIKSFFKKLLKR